MSTIILQWFIQQDNNIVKICVVNQDKDILVKCLLLHDWSVFDYKCNFAFNARGISARGAEKRAGGAGNSLSLGIGERAGSIGTHRCA